LLQCAEHFTAVVPALSRDISTGTETKSWRHMGRPGIYELSAGPTRAVLRRILELSLRALVEDLVLSYTTKYGTWQDVRPPNFRQHQRLLHVLGMSGPKIIGPVIVDYSLSATEVYERVARFWLTTGHPKVKEFISNFLGPKHTGKTKGYPVRVDLASDGLASPSLEIQSRVPGVLPGMSLQIARRFKSRGNQTVVFLPSLQNHIETIADILRLNLSRCRSSRTYVLGFQTRSPEAAWAVILTVSEGAWSLELRTLDGSSSQELLIRKSQRGSALVLGNVTTAMLISEVSQDDIIDDVYFLTLLGCGPTPHQSSSVTETIGSPTQD
jgi:hypothetical protein